MHCILLDGERLLYEGEGWGIIGDYHGDYAYGTHDCIILKKKEGGNIYGYLCWKEGEGTIECRYCSCDVPDGIQALIRLQNWGRR